MPEKAPTSDLNLDKNPNIFVETVVSGDYLGKILKKMNTKFSALKKVEYRGDGSRIKKQREKNPNGEPMKTNLIYPGQKIWIVKDKLFISEEDPKGIDQKKVGEATKQEIIDLATRIEPLKKDKKIKLSETRKEGLIKKGERPALNNLVIEEDALQTQKDLGNELDAHEKEKLREQGNKNYLESLKNKTPIQKAILENIKTTETVRANTSNEMFKRAIDEIKKGDVDIMTLLPQLEGFEEMVRDNVDGDGFFEPAGWMQAIVNLFSKKSNKTEAEIKTLLGDKLETELEGAANRQKNVLSAMQKLETPVESQANGLKTEIALFAVFGYVTLFNIRLWQNGVEKGTNRKDVANLINWIKTTGAEKDDFNPQKKYGDNLEQ